MKLKIGIILIAGIMISCATETKKSEMQNSNSIVGTWQLFSATSTEKDKTISTYKAGHKMIKIINNTHFAFFEHDLTNGKDTTDIAFTAGGGTYTLVDSIYKENLEYCNYREWENNSFQFVVKIQNDTLTQKGIEKIEKLGIERVIVEKYKRLRN